jgi:hypothetical protein
MCDLHFRNSRKPAADPVQLRRPHPVLRRVKLSARSRSGFGGGIEDKTINARRPTGHNRQKEAAHGGHHGGAWKVGYADFVTAMMSLFIVLWLLNVSKPMREAIAGYFKDPSGTAAKLCSSMEGKGEGVVKPKEDMQKLKAELEKAINQMPNFDKLKN